MTFAYQFEKADWVAFITYHLANSRLHRRQRFRARLGFLAGFLILGLVTFFLRDGDLGYAAGLSVAGIAGFFAYPEVYDHSVRKRIRKTVDDPDNAKVFGRRTMTLTPEGIHVVGPGAQATVSRGNVVRVEETPDHLFVYLSAEEAIAIPRRSLEGASFEDVKKQLHQHMGTASPAG